MKCEIFELNTYQWGQDGFSIYSNTRDILGVAISFLFLDHFIIYLLFNIKELTQMTDVVDMTTNTVTYELNLICPYVKNPR